jgi:bcr-type benzoyl-CoA reductase subunit D
MALLARSGGIDDEFTFTGGVANNEAAVPRCAARGRELRRAHAQHLAVVHLHRARSARRCSRCARREEEACGPEAGDIHHLGIDVGSSAVKVAVVESPEGRGRTREGAELLATHVERIRQARPRQVMEMVFAPRSSRRASARSDISTSPRPARARRRDPSGALLRHDGPRPRGPVPRAARRAPCSTSARCTRAPSSMDDRAKVLGYRMTSQCASGTGQFLENIARYLGVTLEEVGPLSLQGDRPEKVSGICAVLAETDVINMVSRGITTPTSCAASTSPWPAASPSSCASCDVTRRRGAGHRRAGGALGRLPPRANGASSARAA